MASSLPTCVSCGYVLPKSSIHIPCPNCGAVRRVAQTPVLSENGVRLKFQQRWPGFLGWMVDSINRLQRFWRRVFSRDILIFDLSGRRPPRVHPHGEGLVLQLLNNDPRPGMKNSEEIVLLPCPSDFPLRHSASDHNGNGSGEHIPLPQRIPNY